MKLGMKSILLSIMILALAVSSFALESTLTLKGGVAQAKTDIEEKEELNGMIGLSYEVWLAKWMSLGLYPYLTRIQGGEKDSWLNVGTEEVPNLIPQNFQSDLIGGDLMLKIRPHWYPIAPYVMGGVGLVNFFPKTKEGSHITGYPDSEYDYTVAVMPAVGAGLNILTKWGVDFDLGYQMNFPSTDYLEGWEANDDNDTYWMAWLGLSHTFGKGKKVVEELPPATLDVTPATRNVAKAAGTTDFNIMSNGLWTVTESEDWLYVEPMSGTGDAKFVVTYDRNPGTYARTGEIFVIGDGISRTVKVVQDGVNLKITPGVQNVSYEAGNTSFNINANDDWTITEDVDWLTVTPMSGTGDATFVVNYDANPYETTRTGQIVITSNGVTQTVTVVQAGMQIVMSLKNVNFEFDKYSLTTTARGILDENVVTLKNYPNIRIELQGHTDYIGTEAYNQNLSQQRADAVKSYLVRGGIDAARINTSAWGESKPIADNETDEGRFQNRRVEFLRIN
ncbi:MAG: OmpA family protein [Candidatus Cloacimonadaceae bacterium]